MGDGGEWMLSWCSWWCVCAAVVSEGPEEPLALPVLALLASDEAMEPADEEEVDEVEEVERRASEMLARVVRPQFGSTSSARLLICVVMLSRLFSWAACLAAAMAAA